MARLKSSYRRAPDRACPRLARLPAEAVRGTCEISPPSSKPRRTHLPPSAYPIEDRVHQVRWWTMDVVIRAGVGAHSREAFKQSGLGLS